MQGHYATTVVMTMGLLASLFGSQAFAAEHTKDSVDKIKQNVAEKKAVLVDVREESEWKEGHLADAQLVPLSKLKAGKGDKAFAEKLAKDLPKNKIVYCHCAAGRRSLTAGDLLKEMGYDVRPLKQGYDELLSNGLPKAK